MTEPFETIAAVGAARAVAPGPRVYVLEMGTGLVKVGYSSVAAKRLAALSGHDRIYGSRVSGRFAVTPVRADARGLEADIHTALRAHRIGGELFGASIEDVGVAIEQMPVAAAARAAERAGRVRRARLCAAECSLVFRSFVGRVGTAAAADFLDTKPAVLTRALARDSIRATWALSLLAIEPEGARVWALLVSLMKAVPGSKP